MKETDTILVGVGVGTTKITVIVAEREPRLNEAVQIIGVGAAPSQGIRKGLIVNLEQAKRSVRGAFRDAEHIVGFPLTHATVSFNADGVSSLSSNGMIALGANPRPIRIDDVERVIEAAQSFSIPESKIPLHTIPVRYSIDGNSGIDDPLGMTGRRLEMDLQTITVPMTYIQNIVNCVQACGVQVDGLVIKPVASALGALREEEMRAGVISLSIGGGTTGLAFYREGRPIKVSIIPVGGDHITNDLANVLPLPLNEAEELKKRLFAGTDEIFFSPEAKGASRIDPHLAVEVIKDRLDELFTDLVAPLIPEKNPKLFPAGVVLSGGVAKTTGIETLLADILKVPVRVADPQEYYEMPPGRTDASYVNAVGTIRYILAKARNPYSFIDPSMTQEEEEPQGGGGYREPRELREPREPRPAAKGNFKELWEKTKQTLKDIF